MNQGLGQSPIAGSRGRAPGQGVRGTVAVKSLKCKIQLVEIIVFTEATAVKTTGCLKCSYGHDCNPSRPKRRVGLNKAYRITCFVYNAMAIIKTTNCNKTPILFLYRLFILLSLIMFR